MYRATGTRRLLLIAYASGMWSFAEETEQAGDDYTGRYFASTYHSGLYASAEAAERDAYAMLPWLRDGTAD